MVYILNMNVADLDLNLLRVFDTVMAEGSLTRAAEVLVLRNYKPTLFSSFPALYRERFGRKPRLALPFRREDFRGVWMPPI